MCLSKFVDFFENGTFLALFKNNNSFFLNFTYKFFFKKNPICPNSNAAPVIIMENRYMPNYWLWHIMTIFQKLQSLVKRFCQKLKGIYYFLYFQHPVSQTTTYFRFPVYNHNIITQAYAPEFIKF